MQFNLDFTLVIDSIPISGELCRAQPKLVLPLEILFEKDGLNFNDKVSKILNEWQLAN